MADPAQLWSHLPAILTEYDPSSKKGTVRCLVKMRYKDGSQIDFSEIDNVLIMSPGTAFAGMNLPVRVGDKVVLHIMDRDIQRLMFDTDTSGLGDPGGTRSDHARMHDLSDCVAYTGFGSFDSVTETDYDVWIFNNLTPFPEWLSIEDGRGTAERGRFDSISFVWNYVLIPQFPEMLPGEIKEDSYEFRATNGDTYTVTIVLTGTGPLSPPTLSTAQGSVNGITATGPLPPFDPLDSNYNHVRFKQNGDIEHKTLKSTSTFYKQGNIDFQNTNSYVSIEDAGSIKLQSSISVDIDSPDTTTTGNLTVQGEISSIGPITSATKMTAPAVGGALIHPS